MIRRVAIALLLLLPAACSEPHGTKKPVEVPSARLASAEARTRGANLFVRYCAICHGAGGDGKGARSSNLSGSPRNFHDPVWAEHTPPEKLFATITDGVATTSMPSFRALDDGDRWDLVAYVMSLRKSD